MNPGFCETDGQNSPYTRTVIFGEDDESDEYDSENSENEARMERFKRKVSVFFTGPTMKRIWEYKIQFIYKQLICIDIRNYYNSLRNEAVYICKDFVKPSIRL